MGESGFSWLLQALCWLSPSFHGRNTAIQRTLIQTPLRSRLMNQTRNMKKSGPDDAPSMYLSVSFIFHHCFSCSFLFDSFFVSPSLLTLLSFLHFIDVLLYFGESIKFQFLSYSLFTFSTSPIYICCFFLIFTMNSSP